MSLALVGAGPSAPGAGAFVGPLDDYTTNLEAAFSVRRLLTGYTGNAVRIRRSSDNAEQDIGFTEAGEFDDSAFTTFVGGGSGFVTTWYDQSGNARNATQATAARQPQLVLSAVNGKPALRNDGSDDRLATADYSSVQPEYFVYAAKLISRLDNRSFIGGVAADRRMYTTNVADRRALYAGSAVDPQLTLAGADGSWQIYQNLFSGASSFITINDGTDTTGNPGTNNGGGIVVAAQSTGGVGTINADFAELLHYSAAPSSGDRSAIVTNQNDYYAVF